MCAWSDSLDSPAPRTIGSPSTVSTEMKSMGSRGVGLGPLALLACALASAACKPPPGGTGPRDAEPGTPARTGSPPPAPRVVIVGGGLAGLVTAYELQKR